MRQSGAVAKIVLAVLGGWLTVMPSSVLTIALRMREFDPSGLPTEYSVMLATGWMAMIVGLIGFGQLGDRLEAQGGSRVSILHAALPLLIAAGITLALAQSPAQLAWAWAFAQLPASATVTSALAMSGSTVASSQRGVLSGLIGASSIVALLIGSIGVRALQEHLALAFIVVAVVGALLVLPLALRPPRARSTGPVPERRVSTAPGRWWASAWVAFALASFLLSWSTSTTNGYVVLFVHNVSGIADADVTDISTRAVVLASLAAVLASVLGGVLVRGRRSAAMLWVAAAAVVATALLALLAFPGPAGVLAGATAFGAGFGLANGVELGLLLYLRHVPGRLGRDLGIFNAVTSAPFVLMPAVAAALLSSDIGTGLRLMFAVAAVAALAGAAITLGVALRLSRAGRRLAVR